MNYPESLKKGDLDAMLVAGGSNLTQVVDSKMIGRM